MISVISVTLFSIIVVVDNDIHVNDVAVWHHANTTCWPVLTCWYRRYWQVPFDTFYMSKGCPTTHPSFPLAVFRNQNEIYLTFHLGTWIYIVCPLHTYFPARIDTEKCNNNCISQYLAAVIKVLSSDLYIPNTRITTTKKSFNDQSPQCLHHVLHVAKPVDDQLNEHRERLYFQQC